MILPSYADYIWFINRPIINIGFINRVSLSDVQTHKVYKFHALKYNLRIILDLVLSTVNL